MSPPSLRTARAGFTLIEMMVTLAILAILIGVLAPNLRDFVLNMRLTGQANDLLSDLMLARSEAVKRVTAITVCGKKNSGDAVCGTDPDWGGGWLMVIDKDVDGKMDAGTIPLKNAGAITTPNTLLNTTTGPNRGTVTYTAMGIASTGAASLRLCDGTRKTQGFGRIIDINAQGRAVVTRVEPKLGNQALCQ